MDTCKHTLHREGLSWFRCTGTPDESGYCERHSPDHKKRRRERRVYRTTSEECLEREIIQDAANIRLGDLLALAQVAIAHGLYSEQALSGALGGKASAQPQKAQDQRALDAFLAAVEFQERHGCYPSLKELGDALDERVHTLRDDGNWRA